jgi:hypothetical protein
MYPEDRVLVAYVPEPADFALIEEQRWYRVPLQFAPKGLYAEYIAFYFGRKFRDMKWAIHYFAPNLGHELVTRRELLPEQPEHPRADNLYYKVQLGPLTSLAEPIVSLRWRRVTFIHTTWDRFQDAGEINDLFIDGDPYVDRIYATLKDRGIQAERYYRMKESSAAYTFPLVVPCQDGYVQIADTEIPNSETQIEHLIERVIDAVEKRGGMSASLPAVDAEEM